MTCMLEPSDYVLRILLPFATAWILALICGKPFIPYLHKLKYEQTEREDGPESHRSKTGTPTMGGVIFILPMILVSLFMMILKKVPARRAVL